MHLVTLAHAAVHTHITDMAEGHCAVGDAPALQRSCSRHESALRALRIHPRLKRMPLRSNAHASSVLLHKRPLHLCRWKWQYTSSCSACSILASPTHAPVQQRQRLCASLSAFPGADVRQFLSSTGVPQSGHPGCATFLAVLSKQLS